MSRLHVHISVDDIEQNIRFYSALFGNAPSVTREDYAKWDLAEPAVNFAISKRGAKTGLDHVGIQADSDDELTAIQSRLEQGASPAANSETRLVVTRVPTSTGHRTRRVFPGNPSIRWTRSQPSVATTSRSTQTVVVYRGPVPEVAVNHVGDIVRNAAVHCRDTEPVGAPSPARFGA